MAKRVQRSRSRTLEDVVERAGEQILTAVRGSAIFDHQPTAGSIREDGFRATLRSLLPDRFFIDTGFLFDSHDGRSNQLDIVIAMQPPFANVFQQNEMCLLPCETVLAVMEVKKKLTSEEVVKCLENAASIRKLKPFGNHKFARARSGGDPAGVGEHRIQYGVLALESDLSIEGWDEREWKRLAQRSKESGISIDTIDRMVILDRGVLNVSQGKSLDNAGSSSRAVFEWFVHVSNHLDRESARRPTFDIDVYTENRTWKSLP